MKGRDEINGWDREGGINEKGGTKMTGSGYFFQDSGGHPAPLKQFYLLPYNLSLSIFNSSCVKVC